MICESGKTIIYITNIKEEYLRVKTAVIEYKTTIDIDIGKKTGFTNIMYPDNKNKIVAVILPNLICVLRK